MITKEIIKYDNFACNMKEKEGLQISIGNRVKELRESKNISQQNLAYACGFEKSNMARLESGRTNPTIYTLKKVADNLDVTLCEIVEVVK